VDTATNLRVCHLNTGWLDDWPHCEGCHLNKFACLGNWINSVTNHELMLTSPTLEVDLPLKQGT
jgi:hypothetical protein